MASSDSTPAAFIRSKERPDPSARGAPDGGRLIAFGADDQDLREAIGVRGRSALSFAVGLNRIREPDAVLTYAMALS